MNQAVQNLPLHGLEELRKSAKYATGWAQEFEQHLGHLIANVSRVANSPVGQALAEYMLPAEVEKMLVSLIHFHGRRPDQLHPVPAGPVEAAARQALSQDHGADPTPPGSDTSSPPDAPVTDPYDGGHGLLS